MNIINNYEKSTFTVKEAAHYLGLGVSKTYTLVKEKKIPHMKFGKSIIIPKSKLEQWMESEVMKNMLQEDKLA